MKSIIQMILVLTVLSGFSAGILTAVRELTLDRIEYQQLKFQKEPAVRKIMEGSTIDPMKQRYKVEYQGKQLTIFPGELDGKKVAAFETFGKGYSGDIGVMVGFDVESGEIIGIGVTTHTETPGIGSKAKEETGLPDQFREQSLGEEFKVRQDGGEIDAISGATITSRGVCAAVNDVGKALKEIKDSLK